MTVTKIIKYSYIPIIQLFSMLLYAFLYNYKASLKLKFSRQLEKRPLPLSMINPGEGVW